MNIIKETKNGVVYYKCPQMENLGFKNMFTTRIGGVSFQKNELNFGTSSNDTQDNILKNYDKVFDILKTTKERVVKSKQTHSATVLNVTEDFGGEGIIKNQRFFEADGLITNESDLTLLVFYADCVPIIMADTKTKAVSAVHSGWRGTKANIVKNAVEKMILTYGTNPENIIAAIGPAIGICHFEVNENVYAEFEKEPFSVLKKENGKYYVGLSKTVENQLLDLNIPKDNVAVSDLCTVCNKDLYSFRREGNDAGRMAAFIKTP